VALIFEKVVWAFRCAFFRDGRDIARWDVQCELAEALGVDIDAIEKCIRDGTAFAPGGRLPGRRQNAHRRQPNLRVE
jgi:protein-disulfide isomerase-like protein with CxxC motif